MLFVESLIFASIVLFILLFNAARYFTNNSIFLNFLLLCGSIIILSALTKLESITILVGVSAITYFVGVFLSKQETGGRSVLAGMVGLLIGLFILKNYQLVGLTLLDRIGLSYILFRLIHFLVDSQKKKIPEYNLLSFLNYILFFPTFLAGPIDRYKNFNFWVANQNLKYRMLLMKAGLFRICLGVVKKYFIVPQLILYATDFSQFPDNLSWQISLCFSLIAYSFYILFDFSGYSDIAIGISYLIGIKAPENFNWPYLAKNISAFWKKWHMTFSNFLFEYVFKPLVTNLSHTYSKSPRLLISSIGYVITFVICGLWHGNAINFVYWGLWHSAGLIAYKLWTTFSGSNVAGQKSLSSRFSKLLTNGLSVGLTFAFVTIGWFFFNYNSQTITAVIKTLVSSDKEVFSVSSFQNREEMGFRLNFVPPIATDSLVDIEFWTTDQKKVNKLYSIPVEADSTYYVVPNAQDRKLYQVRMRSRSERGTSDWVNQLIYMNPGRIEPNYFQKIFFGSKTVPRNFKGDENRIFYKNILVLPDMLVNQILRAEPTYFDGYGWGIRLYYLSFIIYQIEVQYKLENVEDWNVYASDRSGKWNFADIHGGIIHNETNRNLAPGKYQVRVRYKLNSENSIWFENSVIIPNYNEEELSKIDN